MEILIVGGAGPDSLEENLKASFNSLENISAILYIFPPKSTFEKGKVLNFLLKKSLRFPPLMRHFERRLVRFVKKNNLSDVIVLTGAVKLLRPETISRMKNYVKSVSCWFVDASVNLNPSNSLNAPYDIVFLADRGLRDYLGMVGSRDYRFLSEGYLEGRHLPLGQPNSKMRIAIVGSLYPERISLLEKLVRDGYPISIYGFGLPRSHRNSILKGYIQGGLVSFENKSQIFREHVCVLNSFLPSHLDIINCRVFEVLASGGLLVTQHSEIIEEKFGTNQSLITFNNYIELTRSLDSILANPESFNLVRESGIESVRYDSLKSRAIEISTELRKFHN